MKETQIQELILSNVPFSSEFDFEVKSISNSGAVVSFTSDDKWSRIGGSISGPFLMTLADASMYAALLGVNSKFEMSYTSNLNIHFLKRSESKIFLANCEIIKIGKRLAVMEVKINDEDQETVAFVSGTYSLP